ncbi:Uncharacterized protein M6B38_233480 [Iris pallida]|uniref:C2 domain-containing protein n=1 Tax=Iris pallida TaxID=29817 RepID=A0AAX6DQM6_IRIPA|nr:Uncharacterized protein M6B38_233480 [Iris pallida]
MEFRKLELTLISAENLKEVNLFSKLNVYAVVSIANDPQFKRRVPPDRVGGRDPVWNYTVEFTVPAVSNPDPFLALHVLLRTERALGDRDVGEVTVPLKELLEGGRTDGGVRFVSYPVRMPHSKKTKGVLNMSYRLGEKVVKAAEVPVMAYPYPMPMAPPPMAGGGGGGGYYGYSAHAAPPGNGHGYGYGYGYQPPVMPPPPPPKRNSGPGFGMGLLGGAVGGLLIGDMLSDDAAAYDAGYDAGFDGGDGFDY